MRAARRVPIVALAAAAVLLQHPLAANARRCDCAHDWPGRPTKQSLLDDDDGTPCYTACFMPSCALDHSADSVVAERQAPFASGCDCSYSPRGFCRPTDSGKRSQTLGRVPDYESGCSQQCCTWTAPAEYTECTEKPWCKLTAETDPPLVAQLLAQMTDKEKLGQLLVLDFRTPDLPQWLAGEYGVGGILGGSDAFHTYDSAAWGAKADEIQASARHQRLKIPVLAGIDAVHGNALMRGTTVFPHNIGMGCVADAAIVHEAARTTAVELRAQGFHWSFAPTLAVAQDVRWGRTYESYSSEPDLVSTMGAQAVRGLQESAETPVAACAKHLAADGATLGGVDRGNAQLTAEELLSTHLPPYAAAVGAGAMTVMASYSSINGLKCHENHWLLTDYLKGHLRFEGFVVSDWAGIDCLSVANYDEQVVNAMNAGVDSFMLPGHYGREIERQFLQPMLRAISDGTVPRVRLDDAVRRVLRVKHKLGLFSGGEADARVEQQSKVGSQEHRAVARRAVSASAVLLLNEGGILPLRRQQSVTVACSGADSTGPQMSGFSHGWQGKEYSFPKKELHEGSTIFEGLSNAAPSGTVHLSTDGDFSTPTDVAIAVVSEPSYAEVRGDYTIAASSAELFREARPDVVPMGLWQRDPHGDASMSDAYSHAEADYACLRNLAHTQPSRPIVLVVLSGRPLDLSAYHEDAQPPRHGRQGVKAIVAAWLPGSEGGDGLADLLYGDQRFTGQLSRPWGKHWPIGFGGPPGPPPSSPPRSPDPPPSPLPPPPPPSPPPPRPPPPPLQLPPTNPTSEFDDIVNRPTILAGDTLLFGPDASVETPVIGLDQIDMSNVMDLLRDREMWPYLLAVAALCCAVLAAFNAHRNGECREHSRLVKRAMGVRRRVACAPERTVPTRKVRKPKHRRQRADAHLLVAEDDDDEGAYSAVGVESTELVPWPGPQEPKRRPPVASGRRKRDSTRVRPQRREWDDEGSWSGDDVEPPPTRRERGRRSRERHGAPSQPHLLHTSWR